MKGIKLIDGFTNGNLEEAKMKTAKIKLVDDLRSNCRSAAWSNVERQLYCKICESSLFDTYLDIRLIFINVLNASISEA